MFRTKNEGELKWYRNILAECIEIRIEGLARTNTPVPHLLQVDPSTMNNVRPVEILRSSVRMAYVDSITKEYNNITYSDKDFVYRWNKTSPLAPPQSAATEPYIPPHCIAISLLSRRSNEIAVLPLHVAGGDEACQVNWFESYSGIKGKSKQPRWDIPPLVPHPLNVDRRQTFPYHHWSGVLTCWYQSFYRDCEASSARYTWMAMWIWTRVLIRNFW